MISEQVETSVANLVEILTKELTAYVMNPLFVQCFESIVLPGYACSADRIDEHIKCIKGIHCKNEGVISVAKVWGSLQK